MATLTAVVDGIALVGPEVLQHWVAHRSHLVHHRLQPIRHGQPSLLAGPLGVVALNTESLPIRPSVERAVTPWVVRVQIQGCNNGLLLVLSDEVLDDEVPRQSAGWSHHQQPIEAAPLGFHFLVSVVSCWLGASFSLGLCVDHVQQLGAGGRDWP
eukprot:CAMPEP_0117681862 /NCGR_PEP_ID=MMETSP0804-20121206/19257_1 /TAXON_ID=1074897 /ORGANISM="Tetraselmis astigmatica, Strain CCMP880" /LENGTH=154 /DNA_ID=CAMNT_0005491745 /DNA_START=432 /DNA_END=893 /DNA_ORIENTATION=+